MGRHDAGECGAQPGVGRGVVGQDGGEAAFVDRHVGVRIGRDKTVAGEVFAAIGHTRLQQAVHQAFGQQAGDARVAVEGAVTDDAARAMIEVEDGGEAEIYAAGTQLCAEHITRCRRCVGGAHGTAALHSFAVIHPHLAQRPHRRQVGEAVGAKTLHPAAFMVHTDQQVGPHGLDVAAQRGELGAVLPVAGEQDDPGGERVLQAAAVGGGQGGASDVEDQGGMDRHKQVSQSG